MAALAIGSTAQEPAGTPAAQRSLLGVVKRYADTLMEHGRDAYGPQKTGLLLSALDREKLVPLTTRPAAPSGVREGDRAGPREGPLIGSNLFHDQDVLRLFYALSSLPGESPRYREAADAALAWFLRHTASPQTGLLPWGEHLSWNVMTDEVASGMLKPVHEMGGAWLLWDRCYELAPTESTRFALGLWQHQIADQASGAFDRHARYDEHKVQPGMEFARHAGFFISTWAQAYAHTRDETFLTAITTLLGRIEKRRHPWTGLIDQCCGRKFAVMSQSLSMAIDCDFAAGIVPEPLASRLRAFAAREDEVFCGLRHEPQARGFLNRVECATGKPYHSRGAQPEPPYSPAWESHYGGIPTCAIAAMCVRRCDQAGYEKYRGLIVSAADLYMSAPPDPATDTKPATFAQVINVELAAHRLTGSQDYLRRAGELARAAVDLFWEDRPLPRASRSVQHYESSTGAGSLALALLRVHAAANGLPTSIPADDTGR
ncbi:MAG: hypothetical protein HY718_02255 [Planctomycetes bacterium]|nr:hypothetical protein [Planctomycetota bacterium]